MKRFLLLLVCSCTNLMYGMGSDMTSGFQKVNHRCSSIEQSLATVRANGLGTEANVQSVSRSLNGVTANLIKRMDDGFAARDQQIQHLMTMLSEVNARVKQLEQPNH
jgi:hypothetical protein